MTILVLVSLAAIVDAMTGLGRIPVQIKNGSIPWSGVTDGQIDEESAAACAAKKTLKARVAVPHATLAEFVISICLCEIATGDRPPVDAVATTFIIAYRHDDMMSI
jgi:hypothetical protein